ncbi:hypothetical protein LTR84_004267 [Exophiala bonariae]|uniref:Uncharacterized protein n=1 Tax=Exophiala bonariae TaxID=1690606 RepID=A0AAV9N4B1_9EURO|nr:hypothetical protein LTR84_004267 [Exophiala bonariae]
MSTYDRFIQSQLPEYELLRRLIQSATGELGSWSSKDPEHLVLSQYMNFTTRNDHQLMNVLGGYHPANVAHAPYPLTCSYVNNEAHQWKHGAVDERGTIDYFSEFSHAVYDLQSGSLGLSRWIENQNPAFRGDPGVQSLRFKREFDAIAADAECLKDRLNRFVGISSLSASRLSIEESRRGIEVSKRAMDVGVRAERQAHAIGRLTQLAFVFLPLTFVTGVFGMNIESFKDGAPLWKFWITLALIAIPAFIFGLQTAQAELLDRIKKVSRAARRRMIMGTPGEDFRYLGGEYMEDWIISGSARASDRLRNNSAPASAGYIPNYREFIQRSRLLYVLLGVGVWAAVRTAVGSALRRLGQKLSRADNADRVFE